ncbi:MAG: 16S rRNA (adenine(1518)-N(6)/adenine(1519)-N(6))-dimethyltransferase RsmA [Candidatus Omnitrophota bacterium]
MMLKDLRQIWGESGFRPVKRLGQNFLVDNNVKNNILEAFGLEAGRTVVEIGSGFGVMSFEAAVRCGKLVAVEKDKRIYSIMAPFFEKAGIELILGDILDLDICRIAGGVEHILVFGNIPYYISTPIIEKVIEERSCIDVVYLVIQEEYADRVISGPGSKTYGSISCYVQYYMRPKKLFKISKNSFFPRPQVDSCLVRFEMLPSPSVRTKDEKLMFSVIRRAFSQRRKKAVNPLSEGGFGTLTRSAWEKIFEECGISPSSRAEDLSLQNYAALADVLAEKIEE